MGLGLEAGLSGPRLLGSYVAGIGYAIQGRTREAIALLQDALELSTALEYAAFRTEAHYGLALSRLADGDLDGCREECQRGLALVTSRAERKLEGEFLRLLGESSFDQRDIAERYLARGLALCEGRGMRVYAEMTRLSLGRLHASHGSRQRGLDEIVVARDALARMGMTARSEEAAAILAIT
jgi:tetratricopeptide (TPR) repeat protein